MPEKPKINLAALFKMKPKVAAEYLAQKTSKETNHWYEVYEKQHDKIFTVARTAGYDVLRDIRAAVQKAIDSGQTLKEFQKELRPVLQEKGWWGKAPDVDNPKQEVQLGSVRRLETIYTTNLRTSYQAGRYQDLMANVKYRPYWQYVAVMDDRTRREHKELNGKVFRWDSPFWDTFFPPNGWNCRCTVKSLSQKDIDRLGLTIDSTDGRLGAGTVKLPDGSIQPSAVYRLPGGRRVQADAGWNYNPGKSTYRPSYDGSDPELYKNYVAELVQSPPFKNFVENVTERGIWKPVGTFRPEIKAIVENKVKNQYNQVLLSSDTIIDHRGKHDDILRYDFSKIPQYLWNPDYIIYKEEGSKRSLLFYVKDGDKMLAYRLPVKVTQSRELFLTTFFEVKAKDIQKQIELGELIYEKK